MRDEAVLAQQPVHLRDVGGLEVLGSIHAVAGIRMAQSSCSAL